MIFICVIDNVINKEVNIYDINYQSKKIKGNNKHNNAIKI